MINNPSLSPFNYDRKVFEILGVDQPSARNNWTKSISYGMGFGGDTSPATATPCWIEWGIWMPKGTYRAFLALRGTTSSGIAQLDFDGVSMGTFDTYRSPIQEGMTALVDLVVPVDGWHKVRLHATGTKHASSSGYSVCVNRIWFVRV